MLYRAILKIQENADAYHLLGLIASATSHHQEAINLIAKAISIKEDALFYHNLGMVYHQLGNDKESTSNFEKAISFNKSYPNIHLAYFNLGVNAKDEGELQKAIELYNKAIEIKSDFKEAHLNKGLILLLLGNFEEGWKEYEYRLNQEINIPEWQGEKNKKVLVVSEQGFGDDIQFIRYLPLIQGCEIIFKCKPELKELFKNLGYEYYNNQKCDCYINLMSLPRIFKTDISNIPPILDFKINSIPFNSKRLKVGLCWHGNKNQENDKNRSMKFDDLKPLLNLPIDFYCLQKGEPQDGLINLDEINSFEGTASIIKGLDLVISVDTAIAHLAGSLNIPCWTLLCKIPDWRYLLDRTDCLWYPKMKLFRQEKSWKDVVEKVKKELN